MPEQTDIPEVSIVILNWNGKAFLEKFLPFVIASTYARKRVVVIDNASTDDSVIFLKDNFPAVELIINAKNEGFAGGYNRGLMALESDYFIMLNSDVEVTAGWIEPMVTLLESNKSIAACQPKILDYTNRNKFEHAGAAGGWLDKFGYPFARGRVFEICEQDQGQYDNASACFWASGAAMMIRSDLFKEMNGFDAYFFAHQEEIDLCWRLQRAGYQIFVQPQSTVWHVGGGTLAKGHKRKTYLNFRNNLIMLAKNLTLLKSIVFIPLRFSLDAIAAWQALFKGDHVFFMAVVKAHFGFFRWLIYAAKNKYNHHLKHGSIQGMYKGSIVWQHFIKKRNTFREIVDA